MPSQQPEKFRGRPPAPAAVVATIVVALVVPVLVLGAIRHHADTTPPIVTLQTSTPSPSPTVH